MEIKTSLKQLLSMFAHSASDSRLSKPDQSFAAKLTILVAHMQRLEAKLGTKTQAGFAAKVKEHDKHIEDLVGIIAAMHQSSQKPEDASTPSVGGNNGSQASASAVPDGEEAEDDALIEFARQEVEKDIAATKKTPATELAPAVIAPKANNGKKASAGEAS